MPMTPEQIGSVPQQQAMQGPPPGAALDAIRKDPQVIEVVRQVVGANVPMERVPDNVLLQISQIVKKLGVQGAVVEISKIMPKQNMVGANPQPRVVPSPVVNPQPMGPGVPRA